MSEQADTITISRSEYNELQKDSKFLAALEAAGVDNWDGFDFAREMIENDEV